MTRREITALLADVEGWLSSSEATALFGCARRCRGRGAIVEIGSWKGRSTIVLAAGSRAGAGAPVYAVDPHQGLRQLGGEPTFAAFQANVAAAGFTDLVRPLEQFSADAARGFTAPIELIYIDGAHDHASVLADFTAWFPKVLDGGVMAFHDTVGYPGPRRVVRDHLYRSQRFRRIRFAGHLTYAEKVAANSWQERAGNRVRWWLNQLYAARYFVVLRMGRCRTVDRAGPTRPPDAASST